MIDAATVPVASVSWKGARKIIRSLFPPIDLFEDIADPEDWPLLIGAEQKTNPQLMETLGALALMAPARRVSGPGATYLMDPFTHVSPYRPSRFTRGDYGVLCVARRFETALWETLHHHARFMARTAEPPGWTSQFRELVLDVAADLHDLRGGDAAPALNQDDCAEAQKLAAALRGLGSEGVVYSSHRNPGGECAGLFYPDCASHVVQGRPSDYHWNGARVDFYRYVGGGEVFRVA